MFGAISATLGAVWPTWAFGQFRASEHLSAPRAICDGEVVLIHGEDGPTKQLIWKPNGRIVSVDRTSVTSTVRPFLPLSGKHLSRQLLTEANLHGMQTTSTNHYVFVHNTSDEFAIVTRRIMESMIPGIVTHLRAMKLSIHAPPTPLVVLMFRTKQQYQAYQKVPDGVVAYYEPVKNQVVMCEEVTSGAPPRLVFQQQLSTIAHEGVHQILHNIGVQQRLSGWPAWLNEGLAEYFAPTTLGKRLTWKGAGQVNDWRMYELERFLKSGAGAGEMVGDTIIAHRLTSTGYATAWGLTHYLARREKLKFHEMIREYSKLKPLEGGSDAQGGVVPSQRAAFAKHFGSDFAEIEAKVVKHLRTLPYQDPFANEPHFAAFATGPKQTDPRRVDVFHTRSDAQRWAHQQRQTAGVETVVREFRNRVEAETYARRWLRGSR